jgi:hypothetical protein
VASRHEIVAGQRSGSPYITPHADTSPSTFSRRHPGGTSGAFINFADADFALEEYYGPINYQKLRELKKTWAGYNFFKFSMSIPPA